MAKLTHTVSGDIASFRSADKTDIESLKVHFLPMQEGSGDPSPTNVRPITGWTGCNVHHIGKNLFNEQYPNIDTTGAVVKHVSLYVGNASNVTFSTTCPRNANNYTVLYALSGKVTSGEDSVLNGFYNGYNRTIAPVNGWVTLGYRASTNNADPRNFNTQVEIGSVATEYEPYHSSIIPITFPNNQTIYGGYIDLITGDLVNTHREVIFYDGNTSAGGITTISTLGDYTRFWYGRGSSSSTYWRRKPDTVPICNMLPSNTQQGYSYYSNESVHIGASNDYLISIWCIMPTSLVGTTADSIIEYLNSNNFTYVYELETPSITHLTSTQLKSFLNYNNIWSNTNDITEVTYEVIDHLAQKRASIPKQRRRVLWNQLLPPVDSDNWRAYSTSIVSATFEDGVATGTFLNSTNTRYSASICTKVNTEYDITHKYYISYMVKSTFSNVFGVEYARGQQYASITGLNSVPANEWRRGSYISVPRTSGGGMTYIPFPYTSSEGESFQIKVPILIDLTRMFGKGQEPILAEFEALCKLNHVNLEEYQAQNLNGTEQIWYIDDNDKHEYTTVNWNQQAKAINTTNYKAYNSSHISMTVEDGVIVSTWLEDGAEYSWATCANYSKTHSLNSYYYLSYEYYTDIEGYIGGDVGGVTTPYVATQTNQWTRYSTLVKRDFEGNMLNYALYINRFSKVAPASVGSICKARNLIAIDITQMFGAGNEPTTKEAFEQMCQYNNIDLNSQPTYNATGTTMIWRIK